MEATIINCFNENDKLLIVSEEHSDIDLYKYVKRIDSFHRN